MGSKRQVWVMATRLVIWRWVVCFLFFGVVLLMGGVGECWAEGAVHDRGELEGVLKERVDLEEAWQRLPSDEEVKRQTEELLAEPLGLEDALRVALLNHGGLQSELQQLEIARALAFQKMRVSNPTVEGSVWFDKDGGVGEIDAALMFDVASLIQRAVLGKGADYEITIARLEAGAALIGFIEQVRVAYYGCLALEKAYESGEQLDVTAQAAARAAELLFESGNITKFDVVMQQAVAADARGALLETRAELRASRKVLHGLLGVDAGRNWRVSGEVREVVVPSEDVEALQAQAVERSLRLHVLRVQQDLSRTRLRSNRWQRWLPVLEVGVSGEADYGDETQYLIGPAVRVAIPIFGSPVPFEAEIVQAGFKSRAEVQAIELNVRDVYEQLQLAGERVALFRDEVLPLRAEVVEQAQLQFNSGSIDIFALVSARQMQIKAERDYIGALQRGLVLSARMETLMAGGALDASMSDANKDDDRDDSGNDLK